MQSFLQEVTAPSQDIKTVFSFFLPVSLTHLVQCNLQMELQIPLMITEPDNNNSRRTGTEGRS